MTSDATKVDAFQLHRSLVFTIAYDITGSVSDAEDVTQDVSLSWLATTQDVENPRAYLARAAAHHALNTVRTNKRRREDYIGDWLPEPLPTTSSDKSEGSPEDAAITSEAISVAMLVVLQSLSEDQRAAFILRDVFDFGYSEVAEAIGVSDATARQLVHRARGYVRARRQQNLVDAGLHREVVSKFVAAASTGDVVTLLNLLAPDAVLTTDGGGKVSAARRPVFGAENVARFLLGLGAKYGTSSEITQVELNGQLAILVRESDGKLTTIQADVFDGRIQEFFIMRNPDKLEHLARGAR